MNTKQKNVIRSWAKALRSGDYKQSTCSLRDYHGYCCLGVLCDLYSKQKGVRTEWNKHSFMRQDYQLPTTVWKWAGLPDCDPSMENEDHLNLAGMNDCGHYDFNQIADIIEKGFL